MLCMLSIYYLCGLGPVAYPCPHYPLTYHIGRVWGKQATKGITMPKATTTTTATTVKGNTPPVVTVATPPVQPTGNPAQHTPVFVPTMRPMVHTFTRCSVLRWLGRQGANYHQATYVFAQLGIPVAPNTIRCQLQSGRTHSKVYRGPVAGTNGTTPTGSSYNAAPLPTEMVAQLTTLLNAAPVAPARQQWGGAAQPVQPASLTPNS